MKKNKTTKSPFINEVDAAVLKKFIVQYRDLVGIENKSLLVALELSHGLAELKLNTVRGKFRHVVEELLKMNQKKAQRLIRLNTFQVELRAEIQREGTEVVNLTAAYRFSNRLYRLKKEADKAAKMAKPKVEPEKNQRLFPPRRSQPPQNSVSKMTKQPF